MPDSDFDGFAGTPDATGMNTILQRHQGKMDPASAMKLIAQHPTFSQMDTKSPSSQTPDTSVGFQMEDATPLAMLMMGGLKKMGLLKGGGFQGNKDYMTKAQADAEMDIAGVPEAKRKKYLDTFKSSYVPRLAATAAGSANVGLERAGSYKSMAETRKGFLEKSYKDTIMADINPLMQTNGKVIGQAAQVQYNASRGLEILNKDNPNPQEIAGAIDDLSAILQRGAPTENIMQTQQYNTWQQRLAYIKQQFTGDIKGADIPAIVGELKGIFNGMSDLSQGVIDRNTGMTYALYKDNISQEQWNALLYQASLGARVAPVGQPAPTPMTSAPPATPFNPPRILGPGANQPSQPRLNVPRGTPQGGGGSKDSQAVQWAHAHPYDPRAKRILQLNGF